MLTMYWERVEGGVEVGVVVVCLYTVRVEIYVQSVLNQIRIPSLTQHTHTHTH